MRKLLFPAFATALLVSGQISAQGMADLQDAVDSGIEQLEDSGTSLGFDSRSEENGSLVLRGVRMATADNAVVMEADFVRLTPSGDVPGEVVVTVPPVLALTVTPEEDVPPVEVSIASEGFELATNWILDTAGNPRLAISADSMAITGGDPDHPVLKVLDLRPEDLEMSFSFDEATRSTLTSLSIGSMAMTYAVGDPRTGHTIETAMNTSGQTISFTGTSLPEDEAGFANFAERGGEFRLLVAGGASTTSFTTTDPTMPFSLAGTGESGTAEISLIEGSFLYKVDFGAVNYVVTPNPAVMPMAPFDVALDSGRMELLMPVAASDEARDLRLALALRDLEVGDSVWAMIDPEATIPRDPATLELDLTAKARLDTPLSDAAAVDSPMELGQVESVDLDRLFLSAGGATVEAEGAVTLDNTGFVPVPDGAVNLSVAGVQGLAQKLVDLGLVDQMQVGMMMGMMMAFAKPADGPDRFTSRIEFRDGEILANGQPIQ